MYRVVWSDKNGINYHSHTFVSFEHAVEFKTNFRDCYWVKDSWIEEAAWRNTNP